MTLHIVGAPEWQLDDALKECDEQKFCVQMAPHFLRAVIWELQIRRTKDKVSSLATCVPGGTVWACPTPDCEWTGDNPIEMEHERGPVTITYRHCPQCNRICGVKG